MWIVMIIFILFFILCYPKTNFLRLILILWLSTLLVWILPLVNDMSESDNDTRRSKYRIYSINRPGRLLTLTLRVGAYSRLGAY